MLADKEVLREQLNEQLLQISEMRAAADEARHGMLNKKEASKVDELLKRVHGLQDTISNKDREVSLCMGCV